MKTTVKHAWIGLLVLALTAGFAAAQEKGDAKPAPAKTPTAQKTPPTGPKFVGATPQKADKGKTDGTDTKTPGTAPATGEGDTPADGEGTKDQKPAEQDQPQSPFGGSFLYIMIGGFILLYLFMGRGRKKKEAQRKQMLSELKKGDKVISIGGIVGSVIEARDEEIVVKLNDNARMTLARWAIRTVGDEVKTDKKEDTQKEQ
ncbi:MAG: preprotein translocase subunit YajC [Phycisphaerae bacterium]|nr:preprotein translocase subunit YajC [Phycisphaerae bacterium]